MKKNLLLLCIFLIARLLQAQSVVEKENDVKPGQAINLNFEFANLVNVRGWDQNKIKVSAKILINMGQNDDSYLLESKITNDEIRITGYIKDKDKLPQMITLRRDGQTYYFDGESWDSPELQKFYKEHGREGNEWMSHGVAWEIEIDIMVPRNAKLLVTSKYAMIDIEEFSGSVKAVSKHGGVDLAVPDNSTNSFNLLTQWGVIYTNLDFAYRKKSIGDKPSSWTSVESTLNGGKGARIDLESKHGNLYLRRAR